MAKDATRLFTPAEAREVIRLVEGFQRRGLAENDYAFVFAADEFYIRAGRPFPDAAIYGDFAQIEDGIGMAALFLRQWEQCRDQLPAAADGEHVGVVTGLCGAAVIGDAVSEMARVPGARVELVAVPNRFFGENITVTGLLTAQCLLATIRPGSFDRIVIPDNMLKFDEDIFLDDVTLDQLSQRLRMPVTVVDAHAGSLLQAVFCRETAE